MIDFPRCQVCGRKIAEGDGLVWFVRGRGKFKVCYPGRCHDVAVYAERHARGSIKRLLAGLRAVPQ